MSRSVFNLLLDTVLLVSFCVLIWSAVVVRFVFPPGPDARGWLLWALDYDQWATIQFGLIAILALGILLHVMLHWSWVCGMLATRLTRNKKAKIDDGTQTLLGAGLLIVLLNLLGLAVAAAALSIRGPL
jgi:Domain of unknown function (DUF4405)